MKEKEECCAPAKVTPKTPNPNGAVYGLGFIGSAVYFIGHATTFWMGALGLLKAIVWPAILVYQAFQALAK